MPIRSSRTWKEAWSDQRGTSVIEFALFAPIVALMVMGIVDFARGFSAKFTLESAVQRTLEKAVVGSIQADYQYLRNEAAQAAGVPVANVTVTNWLECNGVKNPSFTGICTDEDAHVARYLQIRIQSNFRPSFNYGPLMQGSANANGNVPIFAQSAVRVQ